jgi:uncharacterized protein YegL
VRSIRVRATRALTSRSLPATTRQSGRNRSSRTERRGALPGTPGGDMQLERTREHRSVEQGQIVMPFYIGADVSISMDPDMAALNAGLRTLQQAIVSEPVVDDVARLSVITFSDQARVVQPLGQVSDGEVPTLTSEGGTNYGEFFRVLAQTIEADRQRLKAQGYKIFRPCVFFLTDGEPLDGGWATSFKQHLTYDKATGHGNASHPIFIPFGFRDAPEPVMRQLAYPAERGRWYMARTSSVKEALEGVLGVIMGTVIDSSMSAHTPKPRLELPAPAAGSQLASGASDYDDDFIN